MRWIRDSTFKPISAYGVIGDTRTAALIGQDGSIDWFCCPRFDSPSVFGALLDDERGGRFRVQPVGEYTSKQRYFPLTNILVTSFHLHDGTGAMEVLDFMPSVNGDVPLIGPLEIHRRVRGLHGRVEVEAVYAPRFDYARAGAQLSGISDGVCATGAGESLTLRSTSIDGWQIDATS
ncbi:MAG TPA: trehalase-like domain-containing protein, partial [Longimicrobiales bacterium]|nr:trehalase-like domain-containing protein [Longimicrobiales bacterium]